MTLNHDKTKKEKFHKQCKRNVSSSRSLQWINSFEILCKKPATIKIPKYESDRHGTSDESTNHVFCGLLAKRPLLSPRLLFFSYQVAYKISPYFTTRSTKSHRLLCLSLQIIAWLEDSLKSTMVSLLEFRNRVIDTISEITKIPKLKFQIGRQKSFQAMFTLYRIVKQSVTESVPDKASVHTRNAAFEVVSDPELYCSSLLLKVERSVSDRFLKRSESGLNTSIGSEIATEPRNGK